jgi:signal transduction histidine kinase
MLHDAIDTSQFPAFPPEVLEELKREGQFRTLQPGEELFTEAQEDPDFFFILSGEVRITRRQGDEEEQVLAVRRPGEFTGELCLLAGGPANSTGRALRPTRVLRLGADAFRRMVSKGTPLGKFALRSVVARHQEVEARVREQEKLAALGLMAASLTHELNNPAAAARRAADQLREESLAAQHRALSQDRRLTEAQCKVLTELVQALLVSKPQVLDALARGELEDALLEWLADHGMRQAFSRASILANAGVDVPHLEELGAVLEGQALQVGLAWIEATLSLAELAGILVSSTERLTSLIAAVKQYTYKDQDTLQEVDLHSGLEATLAMFAHRMRDGVTVTRDYDTSLPKLWAHGGELNQVWTNFIENALDAMKDRGTLIVSTSRHGDEVHVEIGDDGPGIPEELQARIWEPFFTTKLLGQGTGLGLDIARRIVERRLGGRIRLHSKPGDTRFRVELPLKPELPH